MPTYRVYRWPDGDDVVLRVHGGEVFCDFEGRFWNCSPVVSWPFFWDGSRVMSTYVPPEKEALVRRLTAFLVDVGVPLVIASYQKGPSLVSSVVRRCMPYPRWVDDQRWEERYEEASRYTYMRAMDRHPGSKYLGLIDLLEILPPEFYSDDLWHASWSGGDLENVPYFHALVDQLLEKEMILPQSSQRAWEAQHLDRGEWVLPSPQELEVLGLLGQPNPLLLPESDLLTWLGESGAPDIDR